MSGRSLEEFAQQCEENARCFVLIANRYSPHHVCPKQVEALDVAIAWQRRADVIRASLPALSGSEVK